MKRRLSGVFRISAYLFDEVNPTSLAEASNAALAANPYFGMVLKKGLFWRYLETPPASLKIAPAPEAQTACAPLGLNPEEPLVRILFFKNKIALEASHILTDGTGALGFLKDILQHYAEGKINPKASCELHDKYAYHCRKARKPSAENPAWRMGGRTTNFYRLTSALVSAQSLLEKSAGFKVTAGQFLCACQIFALQNMAIEARDTARAIRICVPVNLRKIFSDETPRNFFLSVYPDAYPFQKLSLGQICLRVKEFMAHQAEPEALNATMSRNLNGERNDFVRHVPLAVKEAALRFVYRLNMRPTSSLFTNLGKVSMPAGAAQKAVMRLEVAPTPNYFLKASLAAVTFADTACLTIGSYAESSDFEEKFFDVLLSHGLDLNVYSNTSNG